MQHVDEADLGDMQSELLSDDEEVAEEFLDEEAGDEDEEDDEEGMLGEFRRVH